MFCSLVSDWISNSPSVQFLCRQFLKYSFFCWLLFIFSIHCLVLIVLITNNNEVLMGDFFFFLMEKFFAEFTFLILALIFCFELLYFWFNFEECILNTVKHLRFLRKCFTAWSLQLSAWSLQLSSQYKVPP